MRYNEILEKKVLGERIVSFRIYSPEIARRSLPGQFVVVRIHEKGERIPLTLCDWDGREGWIRLVVQEVGKSTYQMGDMEEGEIVPDILGPLGKPADIDSAGRVVCVGGGVGTAELFPIARAYKEKGNFVIGIMGFRSSRQVILEEELNSVLDTFVLTTEDGSRGREGLVTEPLEEILRGNEINLVYAVGPIPMMKAVSELTKKFEVRTLVSLNPIMVDGTGMCGSCRVTVGGKVRFSCVDGPEFDGHQVDFEELMLRNQRFQEEERRALKIYLEGKEGRSG